MISSGHEPQGGHDAKADRLTDRLTCRVTLTWLKLQVIYSLTILI